MQHQVSILFKAHLEQIRPFINKTPVLQSEALNQMTGCSLWFKCENLQPIGAFKIRGAMRAALELKASGKSLVFGTHSSGNHAQAVAYAANKLGGEAHIVMPENAPQVKVRGVEFYGGKIYFCKPTLAAREETLEEVVNLTGASVIHPYNDARVVEGQGTCAFEMLHQLKSQPDVVMAPVGGGGLLSGTALATKQMNPAIQVIAGEPAGADDAYRSFKSRELVKHHVPDTIADGLLTTLGSLPFEIICQHVDDIITVSDEEIVRALNLILKHLKMVVEPSAAVPLAALIKEQSRFKGKIVAIILSGGNVDMTRLAALLHD